MSLQAFISLSLILCHMGKMNIIITDKTERRFRDAVTRYKGTKKGSISKAVEEAFELWIESYNTAIFQK